MNNIFILMLLPWFVGLFPTTGQAGNKVQPQDDLDSISISGLESRLKELDTQLANLASFSLRGGIGSIGYRSYWENPTQWVEIQLDQAYPIDEIVLVPCLWRHPTEGFKADAFPIKIRVLAGTSSETGGTKIAEYRMAKEMEKGIEPLILEGPGSEASWIRIEATELSKRNFDKQEVLQLSEILVFSGMENVALHASVKSSSNDERGLTGAWSERFLVDGFTPYLMDSSVDSSSNAFIAFMEEESKPSITLDLESKHEISRIHMHAVEQDDTVPQAYAGDLGIPKYMLIEGAISPDFSDSITLLNYKRGSINETGPIIMFDVPNITCRYIRFTPLLPENDPDTPINAFRIGFAEIEVISKGENVARGKIVHVRGLRYGQRSLDVLTDGNNLYGRILPIREWMNQLAMRGTLEKERPILIAELNRRYDHQKKLLTRMIWLVLLLLIGIAFIIIIDRYIRMRKVNQVRERIAADLHDDLGANIHTIGLISDMAKKSVDARDDLLDLLDQIREFTRLSGEAARYCTNILEARGICEDLVEEIKLYADRALADMEHETIFEGEPFLRQLDPHKRIDLFLFYKECVTNILKHSGATKVKTQLSADKRKVCLVIFDNGKGLKNLKNAKRPQSLKRRAKLLGAKLKADQPASGGTRIILELKPRKFGFF